MTRRIKTGGLSQTRMLAGEAERPQPQRASSANPGQDLALSEAVAKLQQRIQVAELHGLLELAVRLRRRLYELTGRSLAPSCPSVRNDLANSMPKKVRHETSWATIPMSQREGRLLALLTHATDARQALAQGTDPKDRLLALLTRPASAIERHAAIAGGNHAPSSGAARQQRMRLAGAPSKRRRSLHRSAGMEGVRRRQAIWDCFSQALQDGASVPRTRKAIHALARKALAGNWKRGISRDTACAIWQEVIEAARTGPDKLREARPRHCAELRSRADPWRTIDQVLTKRAADRDHIMTHEAETRARISSASPITAGLAADLVEIACCKGTASLIGGNGLPLLFALRHESGGAQIASAFLADASMAPHVKRPIGHLVIANKATEDPDHRWQMLQTLRGLRAVGIDHRRHGWIAISHGAHVHVLFNRVRDDAAVVYNESAAVGLCLERARLDHESGFPDRLAAVDSSHNLVRRGWADAAAGKLAYELRHAGRSETIPAQGPAYDRDIRNVGWCMPTATAGLWTLKACIAAERVELEKMIHHVMEKMQPVRARSG